jgi:alkylation response protein AidB-like acyl-CoA dehydrogenase
VNRAASPVPDHPIRSEVEEAVRRLDLARRSAEIDRAPRFPREEFRELGRRGLLGLRTPTAYGGRGLSMTAAAIGLYHLAYGAGTTFAKLSLQPDYCGILAEHGSPALVERYFRPLVRGETLVGYHVTEPHAGSDAGAISLPAVREGEEYVLSGTKTQAAFAADADAAIVFARTAPPAPGRAGISAFLVPQDLRGVSREAGDDLGERWMRRGTVRYDAVRVPVEHRIGEEGLAFEYLKGEFNRERLLLAAVYLGVARASFDDTVRYAGNRRAFGRPISRHEAVGFPLVEDWARLDAAWLYVARALEQFEAGRDVAAEAALAKWLATETALTAIDHAIQFHGGDGYSNALPHEQRWRDVRSGALAHGPSEIMHLVAVRELWPRSGPADPEHPPGADPGAGGGRPTPL